MGYSRASRAENDTGIQCCGASIWCCATTSLGVGADLEQHGGSDTIWEQRL